MCETKKTGGLGIGNIQMWNKAAIGKLVWNIAKKQDSLWVKWISEVYVKKNNLWEFEAPKSASWGFKCICKVKHELVHKLRCDTWAVGATLFHFSGVQTTAVP